MKNIIITNCNVTEDKEFDCVSVELTISGPDMTSKVLENIIERVDNFFDANGLSDVMTENIDTNVWSLDLIFNSFMVGKPSETKESVLKYIKHLIEDNLVQGCLKNKSDYFGFTKLRILFIFVIYK